MENISDSVCLNLAVKLYIKNNIRHENAVKKEAHELETNCTNPKKSERKKDDLNGRTEDRKCKRKSVMDRNL